MLFTVKPQHITLYQAATFDKVSNIVFRAGYRKKRPGPVNKTRPPSLKTNFSNILFNTAHNFIQSGFPNILNEKIS